MSKQPTGVGGEGGGGDMTHQGAMIEMNETRTPYIRGAWFVDYSEHDRQWLVGCRTCTRVSQWFDDEKEAKRHADAREHERCPHGHGTPHGFPARIG